MPLIDLKTNFKSLKYGQDTPGGGDSSQPYIQSDVSTGKILNTSRGFNLLKPAEASVVGVINTINNIGKVIGNTDGGFIRGGAIGAATAATIDTLRIGKFLTDAPRGPLFIAKQIGLQFSNPRLEVKKGIGGGIGSLISGNVQGFVASATGGVLQPTRVYNLGINTLAQVPLNALGVHINRHGFLPTQGDDSKYFSVVTYNNRKNTFGKDNRLVELRKRFNLGDIEPNVSPSILKKVINTFGNIVGSLITLKPLNILKGDDTIDVYLGGPKSVYGIGTTTIRKYDNTEDAKAIELAFEQSKKLATLKEISKITNPNGPTFQYPGADKQERNILKALNQNAINYYTKSDSVKTYGKLKNDFDNRNTGNYSIIAGSEAKKFNEKGYGPFKNRYLLQQENPIDRSPSSPFKYYGNGTFDSDGSGIRYNNTDLYSRKDADILTVVFRAINPFNPTPLEENVNQRHAFSAYMNGFKDNFTGNWDEVHYNGRAESFYIYNKFKRDISFNLQIPCFNRTQLFEKHRNLGQLAATTAGAYGPNNTLGGVLLKINIGNYLVGEYGILNSLSYSIPDQASWDVTPEARLSMMIEASFNFTIIHKEIPRYNFNDIGDGNKNGFFGYLPDLESNFLQAVSNVGDFTQNEYGYDIDGAAKQPVIPFYTRPPFREQIGTINAKPKIEQYTPPTINLQRQSVSLLDPTSTPTNKQIRQLNRAIKKAEKSNNNPNP